MDRFVKVLLSVSLAHSLRNGTITLHGSLIHGVTVARCGSLLAIDTVALCGSVTRVPRLTLPDEVMGVKGRWVGPYQILRLMFLWRRPNSPL